jgi:hypothetical protein
MVVKLRELRGNQHQSVQLIDFRSRQRAPWLERVESRAYSIPRFASAWAWVEEGERSLDNWMHRPYARSTAGAANTWFAHRAVSPIDPDGGRTAGMRKVGAIAHGRPRELPRSVLGGGS